MKHETWKHGNMGLMKHGNELWKHGSMKHCIWKLSNMEAYGNGRMKLMETWKHGTWKHEHGSMKMKHETWKHEA
jgi:hypothetical protein